MRICVPLEENDGLESVCYSHFGSAPYFFIHDTELQTQEIVNNANAHHAHGQCNPVATVLDSRADTVIVGGIGPGAVMKLESAGVNVYRAEYEFTMGELVENPEKFLTSRMTMDNSCRSHGCGH